MSGDAADCLRRALVAEAVASGASCPDSYAFGALSFLASQLYDRGETARCSAVAELRRLEAAGRVAIGGDQ